MSLGGAGAVGLWTVYALKAKYDVTLVTTEPIDLDAANAFFGIRLSGGEFEHVEASTVPVIGSGFLGKVSAVERWYSRRRHEYDLAIATRCEMDLGGRGIQYIHFPTRDRGQALASIGQGSFNGPLAYWRKAVYAGVLNLLSGYARDRMLRNRTLTNSAWTADIIKTVYNIDADVVTPPVWNEFPKVPWQEREEAFVSVGAISPRKGQLQQIRIVAKLRQSHPELKLYIVGRPADQEYANQVKTMVVRNSQWVTWNHDMDRAALVELLGRCKYGIHSMQNEHYGIAVAEMVNAGCLTFVRTGGGQEEIVGDPRLIYRDVEDAVAKIDPVLRSSVLQMTLRDALSRRQVGPELFVQAILKTVSQELSERYERAV